MQNRQRNAPYYFLLIIEGLLAFGVGIFGNKASELFEITPSLILFGGIILITLAFLVTIAKIRLDKGEEILPSSTLSRLIAVTLGRVVTIFPVSIIVGAIISFICVSVIPRGPILNIMLWRGPWDYELAAYIIALILIYKVGQYKSDYALLLTFAIGFSIGLAGAILLIRPQENSFLMTLLSWGILLTLTALFVKSRTFKGLTEDLSSAFQNIAKER